MSTRSHTGELLYRTADRIEAAMIEIELGRHAIPAVSSNGDGIAALGALPAEPFYVEIWVPADRVSEARRVVDACLAKSRHEDAT
jgi:hypothetical protein